MKIDFDFGGVFKGQVLERRNVAYLDPLLLDERGLLRPHPAATFQVLNSNDLRYWAHLHAVYQFPTLELIGWLKDRIGERSAIEVGAGHGAIGRALGITVTDSYVQVREAAAYYASTGQPAVRPPDDVKDYEANDAVRVFKPRVVLGCWVTQKYREADDPTPKASIYGVNEERLLERVDEYIHVGNRQVHGTKRILAQPHEEKQFPWLVSRAGNPEDNVIYIWKKP